MLQAAGRIMNTQIHRIGIHETGRGAAGRKVQAGSSSFFLFYAFVFRYPSVCNQTKNAVEQDQEMKDNMIQIGDQAFVAHRKDAH